MNLLKYFFLLVLSVLSSVGLMAETFDVLINVGKTPDPHFALVFLMNSDKPSHKSFREEVTLQSIDECKQHKCSESQCLYARGLNLYSSNSGEVFLTRLSCESESQRYSRLGPNLTPKEDIEDLKGQLYSPETHQFPTVSFSDVLGAFVFENEYPNPNTSFVQELMDLKNLIKSFEKPITTFLDGDIEDALSNSGFTYPSKTIYQKEAFPHFLIKTDQPIRRFQEAKLITAIANKWHIQNVVVPQKHIVYSDVLKSPSLIVQKFDIETDTNLVRKFYETLNLEEAVNILFIVLKSRIKDIEKESAWENLPYIKGTRTVAFIDTGAGIIENDRDLIESINHLCQNFNLEVTRYLKIPTLESLHDIHSPADLYKPKQ